MSLDVRRVAPTGFSTIERASLEEMLRQVARVGVTPRTVVDVGAAYGSFTKACTAVFPDARYLAIEPLIEYESSLSTLAQSVPNVRYVCAAASSRSGDLTINVHPDLVGSSLLREVETGTDVNGVPRTIRAVTVDGLITEGGLAGPYLLKVDVQGAELDVLRGAEALLKDAEYVLLEVSFFKFFEDGPEFTDMVQFMKERGFVPYDIAALQYRPLDHALSQADVAFVKEQGPFRIHHFYATPAQREEQNQRIQAHLAHLLKRDV
jgi:FkbM family methyltransferase